jgi:hypothetical protein
MKDKPTVGFPYFGAFPSDRIPKAIKDSNEYIFIHSSNSCKSYQRIILYMTTAISGTFFEAMYVGVPAVYFPVQDKTLRWTNFLHKKSY